MNLAQKQLCLNCGTSKSKFSSIVRRCLRRQARRPLLGMVWLAVLALLPSARAEVFSDDLCHGINQAYWIVQSNQALYTVEPTTAGVRFSKPVGGTYGFQYVVLQARVVAQGDFDMSVDYTNASIDRVAGSPGNQVQLNCSFGGQFFCVARTDENGSGHNIHAFASPPGSWYGERGCPDTFGTMRITRTNAYLSAYYNGTLIHAAGYNTNDVTFQLALQNNGTIDATAVTFANFQLTAGQTLHGWPSLKIQTLPPDQVLISWPADPSGYFLHSSPSLPGTGFWEAVSNTPASSGDRLFVTNALTDTARFYQLKQGL